MYEVWLKLNRGKTQILKLDDREEFFLNLHPPPF